MVKDTGLDIGHLSFTTSIALHNAMNSFIDKKIELKWPNDILINNAKTSGVLIERADNDWIIIGIGVNIKTSPTIAEANYCITCLQDYTADINKDAFFDKLCDCLHEKITELKNNGFTNIRKEWLKNAKGLGQNIKVNLPTKSLSGKFIDIDENGILLLETENKKITKITAGDVFFS